MCLSSKVLHWCNSMLTLLSYPSTVDGTQVLPSCGYESLPGDKHMRDMQHILDLSFHRICELQRHFHVDTEFLYGCIIYHHYTIFLPMSGNLAWWNQQCIRNSLNELPPFDCIGFTPDGVEYSLMIWNIVSQLSHWASINESVDRLRWQTLSWNGTPWCLLTPNILQFLVLSLTPSMRLSIEEGRYWPLKSIKQCLYTKIAHLWPPFVIITHFRGSIYH